MPSPTFTATRLPDWRARLADYIMASRDHAFAWGQHDCVLFAAGAAMATTGCDPIKRWRGKWSDAASGLRIIHRGGGLEVMANRLFVAQPVAMARRGDWLLMPAAEHAHGHGLAVCDGAQAWAYVPGSDVLTTLPTAAATMAYKVG